MATEKTKQVKPFSIGFVMRTTRDHVKKSVEISKAKTMERISDFESNTEKGGEVFKTLASLQAFQKHIEAFETANPEIFKGD